MENPGAFTRLEILRLSTEKPDMIDAAFMGVYKGLKDAVPESFGKYQADNLKRMW